jgi:molybdenum cofactor cytidylyltransferase
MITGIILASGYSKRFNGNKLLTQIEGTPLLAKILEEVCASPLDEIIVVYREDAVRAIAENFPVKCLYNDYADEGMSASLKVGVRGSSDKTDGFMFFVGDQIFLKREIIRELMDTFHKYPDEILIPMCNGERTNPICFPARYREELLEITGDVGGRAIIRRLETGIRFYEIEDENFSVDIDTPEDLIQIK